MKRRDKDQIKVPSVIPACNVLSKCVSGTDATWDTPIPFSGATLLPHFPTEALPAWMRDFVEAEATFTQTPPDLGGMLVLAATAVACQRKFRVQIRPGYLEPLNLFTVVGMDSGLRKSAVFDAVMQPIVDYEASGAATCDEDGRSC